MTLNLGSSNWNTFNGWEWEITLNGYNFLIGRPLEADLSTNVHGRFLGAVTTRHLLSVAPTRSGKGVSLIIPNLLLYRGATIVIDPKGENAWITAEYRRTLGQKTIILDPWSEVNRRYGAKAGEFETVARFNPLSILDPVSEHYAEDVGYLADAVIINQGKDPHWDDSARELVAGLMAYVVEHPDFREEASLPLVRLLLSKPVADICALAQDARQFGPESVAARKLGRFVVASKEMASIISTALTQTAFLDSKTLAANMGASDFSFEDLLTDQGVTIYLVLPIDKLQTFGRWLRLMVSIGIRTVARNTRKLPLPVLFMLDEFGTIGRLSAVEQAYGLMAGLQMIIWAFVQDLVQLRRDYPDSWETFIGNSEAVTFFCIMDQFTCEHVSKMLGKTTIERISAATERVREGNFWSDGDPNYSQRADQQYSRDLAQPAEVRWITLDRGILVSRYLPSLFRPIVYYEVPFFVMRARPDPHFSSMASNKLMTLASFIPKRVLSDSAAAQAAIEKQGHQIKKKGLLTSKIRVVAPDGKEKTFHDEAALLAYARKRLKEWIVMVDAGKIYAMEASEENMNPPDDLWFALY